MFGEMTTQYVKAAIGSETTVAVKNYGDTYNSLHEGVAVLKEEVDESRDEYIAIKNGLYKVWNGIRINEVKKEDVEYILKHAELLALEAVQVCAVCNKVLKTI